MASASMYVCMSTEMLHLPALPHAADPVFGFLKSKQGGLLTSDLKWNFTKFLVSREGDVVKR